MYYLSIPICVERIWGHEDLKKLFNCDKDEPIGEIWILSGYPDYETKLLKNGEEEVEIKELTQKIFGKSIPRFPLLIKLLKAKRWLSIQVHPNDEYAIKNENEPWGKNEAWYFLECDTETKIINGVSVKSKQELVDAIESGEIEKVLNFSKISKGDFIYLRAGTVHALGPGALTLEVQQTSDLTYRLYDWGSNRKLHLNKALDVIDFDNPVSEVVKLGDAFSSPYFKISKVGKESEIEGFSVLFLLEKSTIDGDPLNEYSCVVIPPDSMVHFEGSCIEFRLGEFWKKWIRTDRGL